MDSVDKKVKRAATIICPEPTQAEEEAKWKAIEDRTRALDELFLSRYPHLRPTPERLAALRDGKCAHCSASYPVWEHVAHYYCSSHCAKREAAAAAAAADAAAAK